MKKIVSLTFILLGASVIYSQKPTQLLFYYAPSWLHSNIKSLESDFDQYVLDRNENEPDRGGIAFGVTIEKPIRNSMYFQTGASVLFYGLRPTRLIANEFHTMNNPERISYIGRQEYFFVNIPFNLKKDIYSFTPQVKKEGKHLEFTFYAIGGFSGSYMFKSDFERRYDLGDGLEEVTVNEYESSFDPNPFNMALQGGMGFEMKLNKKWIVTLEPTLSHNLFSLYKNGISDRITAFSTKLGVGITL